MSDITQKEADVLLKFRDKLSDLNLDDEKNLDAYLIRWLRARDLNLKKSEDMLRAHLKWREENVESIMEWRAPEKYESMYPMELCGYDRFGYPICIVPGRFTDPEAFWECDKEEYMRYCVQNMEKLMNAMKKFSTPENPICQCVIIHDLDQVNFRPFMSRRYFDFMQESSTFFNENYPEIIHKAYFLYSPRMFTVLFSMIKHVIPKKSVEKFHIYGHKQESWISDLFEHIPPEQLPVRYGGTNAEFDKTAFRNCKIAPGNLSNYDDFLEDGMIKDNVPAGKKLTLHYVVQEPNSKLKWNFKTINHDIAFSVHFDAKELITHGRVESQRKKQEGLITCEEEGKYTMVFDNSYSRVRSKTIYYRVEIEGP